MSFCSTKVPIDLKQLHVDPFYDFMVSSPVTFISSTSPSITMSAVTNATSESEKQQRYGSTTALVVGRIVEDAKLQAESSTTRKVLDAGDEERKKIPKKQSGTMTVADTNGDEDAG